MDSEARRAAVVPLIALASCRDFRDRADAGVALASFAELPEAREVLAELVLDAEDTFVTRATAEALFRRRDGIGLAIVASALADADPNHADWISTAAEDVLGVLAEDRDTAALTCESFLEVPDGRVRLGARRLIATIAGITPVLSASEQHSAG
ncbi:hypothetical protein [Amycolatopsis sp. CA-230715]|uniref:hypothetical protein n=1 Tax=Amycolatopsis sp. CA-230715 TaxID=2745196 RepID=UPI001C02D863|nr:hypothetical protein [Amycolatopsis sp. CA-230715]